MYISIALGLIANEKQGQRLVEYRTRFSSPPVVRLIIVPHCILGGVVFTEKIVYTDVLQQFGTDP